MSEISKKDRFTVPAVICLICNVLLFIHLCGAGAYAGGDLHYEAANTQMERNEEFFHQFFLSNHLMGIAETLAMVARAHCLADGNPCLVEKCRGAPDKAAGSLHF